MKAKVTHPVMKFVTQALRFGMSRRREVGKETEIVPWPYFSAQGLSFLAAAAMEECF